MASSSYRLAPGARGTSPWRRPASLALAVAAHILVIWLLLRLAPAPTPPPESPPLSTFALDAERPSAQAAAQATRRAVAKARTASASSATRPPPPLTPPVSSEAKAEWPAMLSESFDLASVPKTGTAQGESARGDQGTRGDSVAAYGPGAGPGGQRLYNADWMREPTDGEINGYIQRTPPPGSWALIACRAAPDNRVENCRSLEESPIGSGFASAMRQAAWQFRVLPPRIGGRAIMGAWVRICIDLRADEQGRGHCRPSSD